MQNLPVAYFSPDTIMPVASIMGGIAGVAMIFGRAIVRVARRTIFRDRVRPSQPLL
jgi:hypothetical protein